MSDLYELFSVDYTIDINSIKLTREFNDYFADVSEYEIVGIRGYWLGNQMLHFNVCQIIVDIHRLFEPFKCIQMIRTSTLRHEDDLPHVTAHDMLRTFPEYDIRFYNNVHHVPRANRLKFATDSISSYLENREQEGKDSLKQKIFSSSTFMLEKLEYKTSININVDNPDLDLLNSIMSDRNMEITEGSGMWTGPDVFNINRLVFKTFDDAKENPITNIPRIVGIERHFKKTSGNAEHIVLNLSQNSPGHNTEYSTLLPSLFSSYPYVMLTLKR